MIMTKTQAIRETANSINITRTGEHSWQVIGPADRLDGPSAAQRANCYDQARLIARNWRVSQILTEMGINNPAMEAEIHNAWPQGGFRELLDEILAAV